MTYEEWTECCRKLDRMKVCELRAFAKRHGIKLCSALKGDMRREISDKLWRRVGA